MTNVRTKKITEQTEDGFKKKKKKRNTLTFRKKKKTSPDWSEKKG